MGTPPTPSTTDTLIAAFEAAEAQLTADEALLATAVQNAAPLDSAVVAAQGVVTTDTANYKAAVGALIAQLQTDLIS